MVTDVTAAWLLRLPEFISLFFMHTCLLNIKHVTVNCMPEQQPSMRRTKLSKENKLASKHLSCVFKTLQKVPIDHKPYHKYRRFGKTTGLLKSGWNSVIRPKGPGRWDSEFFCGHGRTLQMENHQFCVPQLSLPARSARQKLFLSKSTSTALWESAKRHLNDSQSKRRKTL